MPRALAALDINSSSTTHTLGLNNSQLSSDFEEIKKNKKK